jgi:hypothetical protein
VAGREQTAQRQNTGFFLNGQLLAGFFIWLTSKKLRSVGDFFASTVLLHDPDEVSAAIVCRLGPLNGHAITATLAVGYLVVALCPVAVIRS